jgi:hypothetical protein
MKEVDNSANFAAGRLSIAGHMITHAVETRTTLGEHIYGGLQGS